MIKLNFIFKTLVFSFLIFILNNKVYGISDEFKFVIDTIGIPRYNVYMEEINEDIYKTYNIFAYSSPQGLLWHKDQRFKDVSNYGKWTKYNGPYVGYGERGEYYLLGTSYSGPVISNVYFPVDGFPGSTPNTWTFIALNEAYGSWLDTGKYKYTEQLEYMKNADLLFDEMNFATRTTNPYNLVSYGISVNKIGMNKMILDTASTWKTNGIVTGRRLANNGKIYTAIFATAPMAASADILSTLIVDNNFVINAEEDSITIPIKISAQAINLTNYANQKHIKEITSILYINNKEITRISGSKTVRVDKDIFFTVSRSDYNIPKTYPINIKVKSYLYTEFSIDGLMQNQTEKNIDLQVLEKQVIPINSIKAAVLEMEDSNLVVRPLIHTTNTLNSDSHGIIEAGKYLVICLEKNIDDVNVNCYINEIKQICETIYNDEKYIVYKIKIDENIPNTIKSWNFLRNETKNYFDINFKNIGERISNPNQLKVTNNLNYTSIINFDTIDKFSENINYLFEKDVVNSDDVNKKIYFKDWIIDG